MIQRYQKILPRIKETIEKVTPDAEIILYGSVARGEETENSDIDILIVVNKDQLSLAEQWAITDPLYEMGVWELILISPHVYTRNQWYGRPFRTPYMINIMNEGIRL